MSLRLTSSALALVAMTAPAFAEVNAEQVWQTWVDYYKSSGYTVTEGSREQAGDNLTVKDVVLSYGAEDSVQASVNLPQVTLQTTGDGNIRTVYPDEVTGSFADNSNAEDPVTASFTLAMPGNETVSSGSPEKMTHEFNYPTMALSVDSVKYDDKELATPFKLTVTNSTGTLESTKGDISEYAYDMKSEKADFTLDAAPADGEKFASSGTFEALEAVGTVKANPDMLASEADLNAALKQGMALAGTVKSGAMNTTFDVTAADESGQPTSTSGKTTSEGVDLTFSMSQAGLAYQGAADKTDVEMTVSQMPFPLAYGVEGISFDIQIPVMKADDAQPFKMAYSLAGLTLSDSLWDLFDGQKVLPRDPASFELDVTGLAKVDQDLMAAAAELEDASTDGTDMDAAEQPFMPTEVTLNRLALSLLGASAEASGDLKAPEGGDITTPVGEVHARYENLNQLFDNLTATGLVPAEQLAGVRMMLAMFAKVDANDANVMTTDIELKEDGSIFANGQQIK